MNYIVTSMRDEVAQEYLGLNIETSDAVAIRNFENSIIIAHENKKGLIYTNLSDFSLYKVAYFDSESASFEPITPVLLRKAGEVDVY